MIGAFFQCHKQPLATEMALRAFRRAYPDSTVILLSDAGDDYTSLAEAYGALYFHESESCPPSFDCTDRAKFDLAIHRWRTYLPHIKEEYFMILEDDVLVQRPYDEPFLGTINGNCLNKIPVRAWSQIPGCALTEPMFYSGHGGSVYHKKEFLRCISNNDLNDRVFTHWRSMFWERIDFDVLCSMLVLLQGGSIHSLQTHKEYLTNYSSNILSTAHVVHQYKKYYK
jgi:hypothetical protein